jgi:hypothetical protein
MRFKRVYIKFDLEVTDLDENYNQGFYPTEGIDSSNADILLAALLYDGWEIVSTATSIGTWAELFGYVSNFPIVKQYTYTDGINVFLVKK